MTRLVWDAINAREFSFGVEKGVVYPKNSAPVVWNGLVSVSEEPENAESKVYYYDGQSYVKQSDTEGFAASIEAVTYPEVLDDEGQFDFSYTVDKAEGQEVHLVYNAWLTPTDGGYSTIDNQAAPVVFKWRMTSVPVQLDISRATSHLVINTLYADPTTASSLTDLLYGTDSTPPRMPTVQEVAELFEAAAVFVVTDNGDGTWTATGPDSWIQMLDATTFEITSPSVDYLTSDKYQIRSW